MLNPFQVAQRRILCFVNSRKVGLPFTTFHISRSPPTKGLIILKFIKIGAVEIVGYPAQPVRSLGRAVGSRKYSFAFKY